MSRGSGEGRAGRNTYGKLDLGNFKVEDQLFLDMVVRPRWWRPRHHQLSSLVCSKNGCEL